METKLSTSLKRLEIRPIDLGMATIECKMFGPVHHVLLPEVIDKATVQKLVELSATWCELSTKMHVFDFRKVKRLHPGTFAPVVQFRKSLSKKSVQVSSINFSDEILEQVRAAGVEKALGYLKSIL